MASNATGGGMPAGLASGFPPNMTFPSVDQLIAETYFRIRPTTCTALTFIFLALSVTIAAGRLYLRLRAFGKPGIDDYFMIAAVIFFAGATAVTQHGRQLLYLQMVIATNEKLSDPVRYRYAPMLIDLGKWYNAQYMLQWSAIWCVKFSYLFFFRPLVGRIPSLEIWWKVLFAITVVTAIPTIFLSLWVCPHYDSSFLTLCAQNGSVFFHEHTLLVISTVTDITTDLMVISIPLYLLTKVQLELKRKLALGTVLCLSIFMIAIAAVRYGFCTLYGGPFPVPDSVWLFFWQSVECFVAISMVSLTAFRSLYGKNKKTRPYGSRTNTGGSMALNEPLNKPSATKSITKSVKINVTSTAREDDLHSIDKDDSLEDSTTSIEK